MSPIERVKASCEQRYPDPDVSAAVLADAVRLGTINAIDDGSRVLPSKEDAAIWHTRMTGKANDAKLQNDQSKIIAALQARVENMERELAIPSAPAPSASVATNSLETHSP